jgi:hypothetical protein
MRARRRAFAKIANPVGRQLTMTNQNTFSDLANADVYDSAGHKLGGVNNVYVFDGTEEPS